MLFPQTHTDQLGRQITLEALPHRIVSLVPSQTELLFDLGLYKEIVGVTWFCIHPEYARQEKVQVGGTKNLKLDKIRALRPDLIIANKEENEREQIEMLMQEFPVWISDIRGLRSSLDMIEKLGALTGKIEKATAIAQRIEYDFANLIQAPSLRTLYLIWKKPYMSIGHDTFIHEVLQRCGLINVCAESARYPELTEQEIVALAPELVLLSSEPYPFKEKHIRELQELLPSARIMLVDGEMFSWYGSRLTQAGPYLKALVEQLS